MRTLIDALQELLPDSSKSTLRKLLKFERVTVDGKIEKNANFSLNPEQKVVILPREKVLDEGIKILFEDKHLVVIEKPAGLLSVAANFEADKTAHTLLKEHYKKVFPVHRLDQDTSGIMIFALTEQARDKLKDIFEKHAITRCYTALCEGEVADGKGTYRSYLYEDDNYVVHSTKNKKMGKLAITHYEVLDKTPRYTKILFTLETGKKNQIRVHCKDAGHPVLGDKKYGATKKLSKRLCLHACLLQFDHPITGKQLRFESPASF